MSFNPKKIFFPINIVLFNLCRFIPFRNSKIWVFGGWEGLQYDDNAKYLYEYVNEHANNVHAVWLTKKKSTVEKIQNNGFEAHTFYSIKGVYFALRAGVAIYSHALIDFGFIPLIGGAKLVCLWHGVGFKKIYNAKYSGKKLLLKKILDMFFSWTKRDLTTVTSDYTFHQFQNIFNLNPDKIFITGQPRNDVLFRNLSKSEILNSLNISPDKKIILYMPTYRRGTQSLSLDVIIQSLLNSVELNETLKKSNTILLIKLHPLTPQMSLETNQNFKILDYGAIRNNQELLAIADMMITDYSSCFVDFALLNRPIMFYTPDQDEFLGCSEKMDDDFFRISELNNAKSPKQLANLIQKPNTSVCEATNHIFESPKIRGTCYCENVYKMIIGAIQPYIRQNVK